MQVKTYIYINYLYKLLARIHLKASETVISEATAKLL